MYHIQEQETGHLGNSAEGTAPVHSGSEFIKHFQEESTPAIDTPAPAVEEADPLPSTDPPRGNGFPFPEPKPEDKRPLFVSPEQDEEVPGTTAPVKPKEPKDERERKTESLMKARDFLQSRLLAYAVARGGSPKDYQYDEDMIEDLVKAWSHYFDENDIKVPANLDLLITELYTTGVLVEKAWRDGKVNKRNEAAREEPENRAKIIELAAQPVQRSRYNIDAEGYYTYDASGNYLKAGEPKERADLKDLDKIVKLKSNRPHLLKLFKQEDLAAAGWKENEEE